MPEASAVQAHGPETHAQAAEADKAGAGARLRCAREAGGLTLGEVAARMHLDQRTLRALEGDDYAALPAPTFVRGYLKTYAQLLSIPPDSVIAAYDNRGFAPPPLVADIGEKPQARSSDAPMLLFTGAVLAGLVTMVVLWWQSQDIDLMPFSPFDTSAAPEAPAAADSAGGATTSAEPVEGAPASPVAGAEAAAALSHQPGAGPAPSLPQSVGSARAQEAGPAANPPRAPAQPATPPPQPAAGSARAPVSGNESDTPQPGALAHDAAAARAGQADIDAGGSTPAPGISRLASAEGRGEVTLRFAEESWVEIYDSRGDRLFWNLARAGSKVQVSGEPPINVVLGKANGATVTFNGRPFDLGPHNTGGVARFELGTARAAN